MDGGPLGTKTKTGPKPYKFKGFGGIHGPKTYKFIWFGDIHGPTPYKFIGFGDIHGPKPYKFIRFGDIHDPKTNFWCDRRWKTNSFDLEGSRGQVWPTHLYASGPHPPCPGGSRGRVWAVIFLSET